MGVKISSAPERVLASITGNEAIPAGDGSNKIKILLSTIRSYAAALFTNKATVLDNLTTSDSVLRFNALDVNNGFRKALYTNKTSEFTVDLEAGALLVYVLVIDDMGFPPTVKIGTTSGGEEISASEVLTGDYLFVLHKYFTTSTTLYINITSGHCDVMLGYYKSFESYI